MLFSIRLSPLACVALFSLAGCSLGPVRCDEPDNSCNQPLPPPALTIHALRQQARGSYSPDAGVPLQNVIITAINNCVGCIGGHAGDTWLQETAPMSATNCPALPDGSGRACAVQVYQPTFSPTGFHASTGDVVNVTGGQYQEFQCATCGHPPQPFVDPYFVPEVSKPTIASSGIAPPPPPVPVTVADLEANINLYMGVLVEVQDITAGDAADTRGEIPLQGSDPRNGLHITQELVLVPGVTAGTHWDRIVGIATYFYSPKLLPRSAADLVNQH